MRNPYYTKLVKHVAKLTSPEEVAWLLDLLLTEAEISDISDRLKIFSMLASETHTQRDIARNAKVSLSKVIRGAGNTHSPKLRAYFRKHFPER